MQIESATLSLDVALEPSARFVPKPVAETAAAKVLTAELASVSRYSIPASTPGACFEPLAVWLSGAVLSQRHRRRNLLEMLWQADARHPSRTA